MFIKEIFLEIIDYLKINEQIGLKRLNKRYNKLIKEKFRDYMFAYLHMDYEYPSKYRYDMPCPLTKYKYVYDIYKKSKKEACNPRSMRTFYDIMNEYNEKVLLSERLLVIILDIDEHKTSQIHNKTLKELTNVKIRRKNHSKKIHEVLTLKEETERRIFVNRDKNACKNILHIGKCFLENQTRPDVFKRKPLNQTVIQGR